VDLDVDVDPDDDDDDDDDDDELEVVIKQLSIENDPVQLIVALVIVLLIPAH